MSDPFTVLIIDDEPSTLETATELLTSDGHRVIVALGGHEGLALARTAHPDLILLDYFMPVMDGLAVLTALKDDPSTRRIPVATMTSGTADDANKLSQAGSIAFIPKPVDPVEFLRIVRAILEATTGKNRPTI